MRRRSDRFGAKIVLAAVVGAAVLIVELAGDPAK